LVLSGILLIAACLAACGGEQAPPSAAGTAAANLRVVEEREARVDGNILSLSPNGQWLLAQRLGEGGFELCVFEANSLTEQVCAALEEQINPAGTAWSPDSTRIAFTEYCCQGARLRESDLWVLEVESGALTNLTDDGVEGELFQRAEAGASFLIDTFPAWSPDSEMLVFSRSEVTAGEWGGTALQRIPASGGEPVKLLTVDEEKAAAVQGVCWSDDEKQHILYDVFGQLSDPDTGIWMVDGDGQDPLHLLGLTDQEMGRPVVVDVSAQAGKALIEYPLLALSQPGPNISRFALLDLKTGAVESLKEATGTGIEFMGVSNATLSPDGSKVLYVYIDGDSQRQLVVRDLTGEAEHVLRISSVGDFLGVSAESGLGLDWAENDTIYAATSPAFGLLLRLGTEGN